MPQKRYDEVLTQKEIIKLLRLGIYYVDPQTGEVESGRGKLKQVIDENGRPFVRLYGFHKRKSISVNRLVWLSKTLTPIPKDFEIHHWNENKLDNRWSNLVCLHKLDHLKLHTIEVQDEIPF